MALPRAINITDVSPASNTTHEFVRYKQGTQTANHNAEDRVLEQRNHGNTLIKPIHIQILLSYRLPNNYYSPNISSETSKLSKTKEPL